MSDNGKLLAGAAKELMEYPEGFFPHKSFRGRYFTGVHDDLKIRALYLECGGENALIISLELGDIGPFWLKEISEETGVPAERIYLCATHTHSAPHIHSTWVEDVIDVEKGLEFAGLCKAKVIKAAKEAKAKARPAVMQTAAGECSINMNRDYRLDPEECVDKMPYVQAPNPHGPSDHSVYITKFTGAEDGKDIAVLVNFAVHSLVVFFQTWDFKDSMLVSSDLSGCAMAYAEERQKDGAICLFTLGAAADQMPRYLGNHRRFNPDHVVDWKYYGRDVSFKLMEAQAQELGKEVLYVTKRMEGGTDTVSISSAVRDVTWMGKVEGVRMEEPEADEVITGMEKQYKENYVPDFHYTETEPITLQLGLLRIGDLSIVRVPAEIVNSIGQEMMKACTEKLGGSAIVISQSNGAYSYISDDFGYSQLTFEALSSHFMPGINHALVDAVKDMAADLAEA